MGHFPKTTRILSLRIYVKDSPIPLLHEVAQIFTEGGLLRLINKDRESIWYPLCNIDKIIEEGKVDQ